MKTETKAMGLFPRASCFTEICVRVAIGCKLQLKIWWNWPLNHRIIFFEVWILPASNLFAHPKPQVPGSLIPSPLRAGDYLEARAEGQGIWWHWRCPEEDKITGIQCLVVDGSNSRTTGGGWFMMVVSRPSTDSLNRIWLSICSLL